MGSFPISQVREPFSVIQYLLQRVNLPEILRVTKLDPEENQKWSAFDLCEAWALKRGYVSARSNRPDLHRSANHILRMTLEGKITLALMPENYLEDRDKWENHEKIKEVEDVLGLGKDANHVDDDFVDDADSDDEDENVEEVEEGREVMAVKNKFSALGEISD